ncbi:unnamed protein product [Schistosoma margrebowiei]|uniref:Uncharacterized protein n=1 Tax=Schistosoma margrebowiei TaxID=48269 RepID=A0A183LG33_9TREM|nr:unnamed protein product [Schistosoma margrebowiei]
MLSLSSEDDRKLAQSAQMYHYQHQKQQMLALENMRILNGAPTRTYKNTRVWRQVLHD